MFNFKQFLASQQITAGDYLQFLLAVFAFGYFVALICKLAV